RRGTESPPPRAGGEHEQSRRTPKEWARAYLANRARDAARRSRSPRAARIRRENDSASRPEIPTQNRRVGVDPAIAEERPIPSRVLDELRITLRDKYFWISPRLGQQPAE